MSSEFQRFAAQMVKLAPSAQDGVMAGPQANVDMGGYRKILPDFGEIPVRHEEIVPLVHGADSTKPQI